MIGGQCKTKNCLSGYVNIGSGCVKSEETCATCSSTTANECVSCPKGRRFIKTLEASSCKSTNIIKIYLILFKAEEELTNNFEKTDVSKQTYSEIIEYQLGLADKFKINNNTDVIVCKLDSDCLNAGKCNIISKRCECKANYFGNNCELSQANLLEAKQKNKLALERLKDKLSERVSLVSEALMQITAVKEINNNETIKSTFNAIEKLIASFDYRTVTTNPAISTLNNLYSLIQVYKNETSEQDIISYYEKIRSYSKLIIKNKTYYE